MSHMVGGSANIRLELAEDVHGDVFSFLFHCHGITPCSAGVDGSVGRGRPREVFCNNSGLSCHVVPLSYPLTAIAGYPSAFM